MNLGWVGEGHPRQLAPSTHPTMQRRVSETSLGSLESQSDDDGVQEGSASE